MHKNITQKEIARRLKVTQQTVSLALSGDGRISEEVREKVRELARKHGYRPNLAARTMQSGRLGNVILVPSNLPGDHSLELDFLRILHDELLARDLHLSYVQVPDEELTQSESLPRLLREVAADGIIIHYSMNAPAALKELVERTTQPVVWVSDKLKHDCVYDDGVAAGGRPGILLKQRRCRFPANTTPCHARIAVPILLPGRTEPMFFPEYGFQAGLFHELGIPLVAIHVDIMHPRDGRRTFQGEKIHNPLVSEFQKVFGGNAPGCDSVIVYAIVLEFVRYPHDRLGCPLH